MNIMKRSKSFQAPNMLFILLMFVRIILVTSLAMENMEFVRICSRGLIALGIVLYIFAIIEDVKNLGIIFWVFVVYLISMLVKTSAESFVSLLCFILMVSTWQSAKSINVTEKTGRLLLATEVIQGLIYIYISTTPLAHKSFNEYVEISEVLTLGFSNPNQTGIILFSTIVILLLTTQRYVKNDVLRIVLHIEIGYLFVLLIQTDARTSIIAAGLMLVAIFMKLDKYKLNKHPYIVNAIPLLQFPFCYVYVWFSNINYFKDTEWMGKALFTGREALYEAYLRGWTTSIIGNVNIFMFANAHNAALAILVNIGMIGFALYCVYIFVELNKLYDICCRGKGIYAMIAILSLFIMGYTESAVLVSGSFYYISLLIFITIAVNSAYEEEETVDKESN